MTDMMTVLGGLYSLVSTLSQESLALRQQVCQLTEEVVGLRTENGVIASRMMDELALAGKDRQVFQMALKGFQDQSEESQREVKLVNKKVTALNTIVKKTATTIDAVYSSTKTLPDLQGECQKLRQRACGNCVQH